MWNRESVMFMERKFKRMGPFTLEELCAWWESEGTLALLPKGCNPKKLQQSSFRHNSARTN